jgi:hypothetical protein
LQKLHLLEHGIELLWVFPLRFLEAQIRQCLADDGEPRGGRVYGCAFGHDTNRWFEHESAGPVMLKMHGKNGKARSLAIPNNSSLQIR